MSVAISLFLTDPYVSIVLQPLRNALNAFGGRAASTLVSDGLERLHPNLEAQLNFMKKQVRLRMMAVYSASLVEGCDHAYQKLCCISSSYHTGTLDCLAISSPSSRMECTVKHPVVYSFLSLSSCQGKENYDKVCLALHRRCNKENGYVSWHAHFLEIDTNRSTYIFTSL